MAASHSLYRSLRGARSCLRSARSHGGSRCITPRTGRRRTQLSEQATLVRRVIVSCPLEAKNESRSLSAAQKVGGVLIQSKRVSVRPGFLQRCGVELSKYKLSPVFNT